MKDSIVLAGMIVAVLSLAGCGIAPADEAPTGAPPTVNIPVGPMPGPGQNTLPVDPYANNAVARTQGRQLFVQYNCYGCHGGHGGGGMGPSLRDAAGDPGAEIFVSIAEGREHGMPAWGTKIPRDQIWKLVAYINSMRTSDEPEPPPPFPGPTPSSPTAE